MIPTSFQSKAVPWRMALAVAYATVFTSPVAAQSANVWTYHNDNARTGQNLAEKILKHEQVRTNFGKLRTLSVDGDVYAQPLFLSGVMVPDAAGKLNRHDVVYVATANDSVYAFDADSGAQLKFKSLLIEPVASAIPIDPMGNSAVGNFDIVPKIGIVGTPVIDVGKSTLYVVSKYQVGSGSNPTYIQRLNALDVTTLEHKANSPSAPIQASYPGAGSGNDNEKHDNNIAKAGNEGDNDGHGNIVFQPLRANQRSGLLLLNGVVYACWGSHGDTDPYHGWVIGFDASTLKPVVVFNSTPNGSHAGIWHAGAAPAADSRGFIYLATGNGTFDGQWDKDTGVLVPGSLDANGSPAKGNYGDSVLKLAPDLPNGRLKVVDYFTPYKQRVLWDGDLDQGAGGLVLLPDRAESPQHRMVTASKDGVMYLLDCDNLGKFSAPGNPNPVAAPDKVFQRIPADIQATSPIGLKYGVGAYFNGSVYYLATPIGAKQGHNGPPILDFFKQFAIAGDRINPNPVSMSQKPFPTHPQVGTPFYMNSPSISSDRTSNAIVWMVEAVGYQPNLLKNPGNGRPYPPAVFHAFDANNLADELYNSDTAHNGADKPGQGIKFTVPTIANGQVFFGISNGVAVYGLLKK